jgi:TPR repeat protein
MAELAHDASGPASSEPAGTAHQASGPTSSDKGKLRVFISYSRDDLDFADQLDAALTLCGFECLIDRHGISGGEDWKRRLGNLISEADEVVFVLSPSSARSEICDWEVEEAARLNKRILPTVFRPLKGVSPPPRLRNLNHIFFYKEPKVSDSGFGTGLANLVAALNTDFDWLREHTRYLQRATEWDTRGRPANRLLSGDDIAEAKAWAARRPKSAPEPTALHLDFIRASEEEAGMRLAAERKQLEAVAAAQAEREAALHDAEEAVKQAADAQRRREEALKQVADAQRKRARIRNIALVAVSVLAAVAVSFALVAGQQRMTAEKQRHQADAILVRASIIVSMLQDQMDIDTKKEAIFVFQTGAEHGSAGSMSILGLIYANGFGVAKDYAKAHDWFEKAAAKDNMDAMYNLGRLYQLGQGVTKDYAKARDWFEKAANRGDAIAMTNLGMLYVLGGGVPQDYSKARELFEKAAATDDAAPMVNLGRLYNLDRRVAKDYVKDAKARDWFEKAVAQGGVNAKMALERLPIREAESAGRYAEALQLQEALAAKAEAEETKRDGAPGEQTAGELTTVAWYALCANEFTKALTVADRAHALFPDNLSIDTNRAHALMFIGRDEEAKALYRAHKGKPVSENDNKLWEEVIAEGYAALGRAGLTHPMMADIEKELGVSPDGNSDIGQR